MSKKLQRDEQLSIRCSSLMKNLLKDQAEFASTTITDWIEFLIVDAKIRIDAGELSEYRVQQVVNTHRKMHLEQEMRMLEG